MLPSAVVDRLGRLQAEYDAARIRHEMAAGRFAQLRRLVRVGYRDRGVVGDYLDARTVLMEAASDLDRAREALEAARGEG